MFKSRSLYLFPCQTYHSVSDPFVTEGSRISRHVVMVGPNTLWVTKFLEPYELSDELVKTLQELDEQVRWLVENLVPTVEEVVVTTVVTQMKRPIL